MMGAKVEQSYLTYLFLKFFSPKPLLAVFPSLKYLLSSQDCEQSLLR